MSYSAGYTDGEQKQNPYNLSKLLYYILMATPTDKRLILADKLNSSETNWRANDREKDYAAEVQKTFWESLLDEIGEYAEKGALIGGCAIGVPGMIVGGLVGAIVGGLKSLVTAPFKKQKPLDKLGKILGIF